MKPSYLAAALAAAVTMTGPAHAAYWIDLTDSATLDGVTGNNSAVGAGPFTLPSLALGGSFELSAPSGDVVTGDGVSGLPTGIAGDFDGLGVDAIGDNDEVDYAVDGGESITMTFDNPTTVTGLRFLDLFKPETVEVSSDTAESLEVGSDLELSEGIGFEESKAMIWANVRTLTFEPGPDNDAGSLPNFALAGVQVVPLPAAAWLMIGGLGALGAYGRRARRTTAASA